MTLPSTWTFHLGIEVQREHGGPTKRYCTYCGTCSRQRCLRHPTYDVVRLLEVEKVRWVGRLRCRVSNSKGKLDDEPKISHSAWMEVCNGDFWTYQRSTIDRDNILQKEQCCKPTDYDCKPSGCYRPQLPSGNSSRSDWTDAGCRKLRFVLLRRVIHLVLPKI